MYDDDQYDDTELEYDKNETENNIEDQGTDTKEMEEIPEITTGELQTAINHARSMANNKNKVMHKKRRRGRCWKLPPDLLFACAVQTVYNNIVQQIKPQT